MSQTAAKKRVLFVEQNMDGTVGGSHFCLLDLLTHLDRDAFEPMVLFYETHALVPRFERLAPVLIVRPPTPVRLGAGASANGSRPRTATHLLQKTLNAVRVSLGSVLLWRRILARHRIDLVHLNNSIFSTGEWLIAARLHGARTVCHQRGYAPERRIPAARYFDRIVCISNQIHDQLVRVNPVLRRNAVAVHDALDTAAFLTTRHRSPADVRREWDVPDDCFLVGIVGNVKEWKGQRVLVDAFVPLHRTIPNARCLIIGAASTLAGDRSYHEELMHQVERSELSDRVILTGYREDVSDIVNALDVLVHASISPEPMGRVILEGMALGKPVVATDHGGPREIIESGKSGFLIPPNDPQRLYETLLDLARSPELRQRMGNAAIERVADAFAIQVHMDRIHGIYRSLWDESKR